MIKRIKGRKLDLNSPVRVYKNLNKSKQEKATWYSVLQHGKVVGHTKEIILHTCKFIVNEAGRQRVLKTENKNVHAFIEGYLNIEQPDALYSMMLNFNNLLKIEYNPFYSGEFRGYRNYTFVNNVHNSTYVFICNKGVIATC